MLLAAWCVAPSPARASCGHGVTSKADRQLAGSALTLGSLSEVVAQESHSRPTVPRPAPSCSGPSCSQRQGLPPVPVPVLNLTSESGCVADVVVPSRGPDAARELIDGACPHPRLGTTPVERPPRPVA